MNYLIFLYRNNFFITNLLRSLHTIPNVDIYVKTVTMFRKQDRPSSCSGTRTYFSAMGGCPQTCMMKNTRAVALTRSQLAPTNRTAVCSTRIPLILHALACKMAPSSCLRKHKPPFNRSTEWRQLLRQEKHPKNAQKTFYGCFFCRQSGSNRHSI